MWGADCQEAIDHENNSEASRRRRRGSANNSLIEPISAKTSALLAIPAETAEPVIKNQSKRSTKKVDEAAYGAAIGGSVALLGLGAFLYKRNKDQSVSDEFHRV